MVLQVVAHGVEELAAQLDVFLCTGAAQSGMGKVIPDFLKQLAGQGSHLAEQQLALIKAEIRESSTELKGAVGAMAGAAVVGLAGLGVFLMGIAYLLGDAIDSLPWGTVIVGAATLALWIQEKCLAAARHHIGGVLQLEYVDERHSSRLEHGGGPFASLGEDEPRRTSLGPAASL